MEKSLTLKATEDTPEVLFDKTSNTYLLSGRSLPEDAFSFYAPLIDWMNGYCQNANTHSELVVMLEYFNSSSVKQLLELFSVFENIFKSGKSAKVVWCYSEGDDLMEIKGLEFQSMLNIPFELKVS